MIARVLPIRRAKGEPRKPRVRIQIDRALQDKQLLGAAFGKQQTWATWFAVLKAAYCRPLDASGRAAFRKVAGGRKPPAKKVRELIVCVSRRGGKGRMGAALAVYEALLVDHSAHLAPGETGVVACVSPTRAQATILLDYAKGYLQASPLLRDEVSEITSDEIRLKNGNVIATLANDYRTLRGRTLLFALLDEASFLRDETSSTPDIETARALLPGLLTTGGMLAVMSSPYRQTGLLFSRVRDYFGKNDPEVLVVKGESRLFNPTLSESSIEAARISDPQAAAAEWFGEFRSDLHQFLDDALVDGAIDTARPMEISPRGDLSYMAFADLSGGRHDASVIAIGHSEGEDDKIRYIADVVRGFRAPHDPHSAVRDFASVAKEYGITEIFGDAYAGDWVSGAFAEAGINYRRSELNRSALYLEGLPLFVRGLVNIPDHPILTRELRLLERRTTRSGRDSVDHGVSGTDDHANALFGMLHRLSAGTPADQWIKWASTEAKREPDVVADESEDIRTPFFLPGNPKRDTITTAPASDDKQPSNAVAKHFLQPPSLRDNPFSKAYFSALSQAEGHSLSLKPPKCACCGKETVGSRVSDGVRAWCNAACQHSWITKKASEARAREIAVNGGLPTKHPKTNGATR